MEDVMFLKESQENNSYYFSTFSPGVLIMEGSLAQGREELGAQEAHLPTLSALPHIAYRWPPLAPKGPRHLGRPWL